MYCFLLSGLHYHLMYLCDRCGDTFDTFPDGDQRLHLQDVSTVRFEGTTERSAELHCLMWFNAVLFVVLLSFESIVLCHEMWY